MDVIVPKLEYAGEVWEGNAKLVKRLETAQMTSSYKSTRMLKYDESNSVNPFSAANHFGGQISWN